MLKEIDMLKVSRIQVFLFIVLIMLLVSGSCRKDDIFDLDSIKQGIGKTQARFNSSVTYGSMTDQNGNIYKTITIGTQTWMAENLRTNKYRNGDAITEVTNYLAWENLAVGAFCNYKNTKNNDAIATLGRLYNWFAVSDNRNIAPSGWHVPTNDEWETLIAYLGGKSDAFGKLKESGDIHWNSPGYLKENSSGFTALPGGYIDSEGTFENIGNFGCWWSRTGYNTKLAWYTAAYCDYTYSYIDKVKADKRCGFSIRCIKDSF